MTPEQLKVKEFHQKFGLTINEKPSLINFKISLLRDSLHREEAGEYLFGTITDNLVLTADALGDLLYVIYGTAVSHGIDLEPIFNEIHRSNMSKVWPDGTVKKNDIGKVIKPPTYSPANISPIIEAQLNNDNSPS